MSTLVLFAILAAPMPLPNPEPVAPGQNYAPPKCPTGEGVPLIYNATLEAGPDESFFMIGEGFTNEFFAWGASADRAEGQEIKLRVQSATDRTVIATLPERAYDGPVVVWAKNKAGYSEPIVLNAPQPWWCSPEVVAPGGRIRIFGRNLACRPDFHRAMVYLHRANEEGVWIRLCGEFKHELMIKIPDDLPPGDYQLWVHAGKGGDYGWGGPLAVQVKASPKRDVKKTTLEGYDLQEAVDELAQKGGGVLDVPAGVYPLAGTLVIPAGVHVQGAMGGATILQAPHDPAALFPSLMPSGWGQGPNSLHTIGDEIAYRVTLPKAGRWTVWLRYATEMSTWKQPGVSGNMTIAIDGGPPTPLENLPNTGSFGTFRWSQSAVIETTAGQHEMVWKNVKGGGIQLDAFVFALDPKYQPTDGPWPVTGDSVVVLQAEDVVRFHSKDGVLPGGDRAAVRLAGDGAGISYVTLYGSPRTNIGIAVRHAKWPTWIHDCHIEYVVICDLEGKQGENCGVRLFNADRAEVVGNSITARAPLFLSGVQRSNFSGNYLTSVTRFGGNAEAYILGRNDVVRKCLFEQNHFKSPPGGEAGGPTGRRMIWLSTGRGSVDLNWIYANADYDSSARFGGVAGTDQNVGEMILFEACERIAYHGQPSAVGPDGVTLPKTVPPTPDERLGSVKREQLAHDAQGNETPFWPPAVNDDSPEGPLTEYFVTVLAGRGMGQTRRIVARSGETYRLDRPWRVPPTADSRILVHTAYWRNHVVNNRAVDGMTGVQLWISCIENVVAGNTVERQRKPGLYLYGNCTTLASSMPRTWNRGIGPLYFNQIEGTRCDETSCGALVISGEMGRLPIEFPRCLGNVLRHNSLTRSRTDGVLLTGSRTAADSKPFPAVLGTIVEFNMVRDAQTGYHAAGSVDASLFRRNHAYFWYPVSQQPGPPTAFQFDDPDAVGILEQNSVEGIHGVHDGHIILEQRGPKVETPKKSLLRKE